MVSCFFFGVKALSWKLLGPAFSETGLRADQVRSGRNPKHEEVEIGGFGVGRPDFGNGGQEGRQLAKNYCEAKETFPFEDILLRKKAFNKKYRFVSPFL